MQGRQSLELRGGDFKWVRSEKDFLQRSFAAPLLAFLFLLSFLPARLESRKTLKNTRTAIWRKGWFMHPFCHLVIKGTRYDSPPLTYHGRPLAEALAQVRSRFHITQLGLAARLGISLKTLQNWERGRSKPNRQFWTSIRRLLDSAAAR